MLVFLKRNCSGDLNEESLKLLYISLVRSNLCYASQLWAPQSPTLMLEVENIQRRATRFICKNSELSYKDRLLNLNLLPINYLLEYLDLLFLYKFVYGIILSVDISVDTQSKVGLYIYIGWSESRKRMIRRGVTPFQPFNSQDHISRIVLTVCQTILIVSLENLVSD